jgi:hypothetical protein
MFISKANRPFRATKEMHLSTIHALIYVCSKTRYFVTDLFTSMCKFLLKNFIHNPRIRVFIDDQALKDV